MSDRVILSIEAGPAKGRQFVFDEHDTFLVGRTDRCHVKLPKDPFVSRHHFMLEIAPPRARLRDLGSLNGTFVNGKRYGGSAAIEDAPREYEPVYAEVDLADGDHVQVGETVFLIELAGSADMATNRRSSVPTLVSSSTPNRVAKEPKGAPYGAPPPVPPAARVGWPRIPGYDIEAEIGAGGMGAVYRARATGGEEEVAIKVLLAKGAVNERAREAFLREIDLLRGLDHPQIASVLDSGSLGRAFFCVMNYYRGGNLGMLLTHANKPLRVKTALRFILLALRGLEYAHERRVVHRDIKPENLLLEKAAADSNIRISDFGLAKSFVKAGLSGMTVTGQFGGTFHFMPPEQLTQFKYVKPISDIWSMGATLYFLLTTQPVRDALPGQDPVQVVLEAPIVPIRERNPSVPQEIAAVIDRSLASDLKVRYPSAKEFREALESAYIEAEAT